jgi:hypothetical protein
MAAVTYDSVASGSCPGGSTSCLVSEPIGAELGDGIIVALVLDDALTVTPPSGYTQIVARIGGASTRIIRVYEGVSDGAVGTFLISGAGSTVAWVSIAVNNTPSPAPIQDDTNDKNYVSLNNPTLPTTLTSRNDQMVIAFIFMENNQRDVTAWPNSFTERADQSVGANVRLHAATRQGIASGTSMSSAFTLSGSDSGGIATIELIPAVITGAASMAGTASISAAGSRVAQAAATMAGVAAMTADGVKVKVGASTMQGQADLTAGGVRVFVGEALMAAEAVLAADGVRDKIGAASLLSEATMAAVGGLLHSGAAALEAVASLTAAARMDFAASALLEASASLTATATRIRLRIGQDADGSREDRYTITVELTQDHIRAIQNIDPTAKTFKVGLVSLKPKFLSSLDRRRPRYTARIEE